jgi:hypothetical protein
VVGLRSGYRTRGVGSKFGEGLAGLPDHHNIGKDGNLVAVLVKNGEDSALYLGFFFEGGFVGFVPEEDITYFNGITDLFLEFGDYAALHGLALFGHYHDLCHYLVLVNTLLDNKFT